MHRDHHDDDDDDDHHHDDDRERRWTAGAGGRTVMTIQESGPAMAQRGGPRLFCLSGAALLSRATAANTTTTSWVPNARELARSMAAEGELGERPTLGWRFGLVRSEGGGGRASRAPG
eukprot:scaffold5014_cov387-Prasinococcus_capsulatus_cf.AAC.13